MSTASTYFRLLPDVERTNAWRLGAPTDPTGAPVDPAGFTRARIYEGPEPLALPITEQGERLDFTSGFTDMLIVSPKFCRALEAVPHHSIQLLRCYIDGEEGYRILNPLDSVRCLDERRSVFTRWEPEAGRPEKVGDYRMVLKLALDSTRLGNRKIFRVAGWDVAVIVDSDLRDALVGSGATGLSFRSIST